MDIAYELFKIIGYICAFVLILYLAQITSKYLAQRNEFIYKNKKIQIVERIYLGKDKEVALIRYKNKEYLIGFSGNITKIDSFELKDDKSEEI